MKIESVNVGLPRQVRWKNITVRTAIFKQPVEGNIQISRLNLAGDRQADLTVHGGRDKAVYGYPTEHYEFWRNELPTIELSPGSFGENLTTEGLREETLFIGDRLRVGSAELMVTQPRMPCYKMQLRFEIDDITKQFLLSRRSGFYFSVIEEGDVAAGSTVEFLSRDPEEVSVTDIVNLYLEPMRDPELLRRALRVRALPTDWKNHLRQRAGLDEEDRAS